MRHWYGLKPSQNGAGQMIVIAAFWRAPALPVAVDRFSAQYGLPLSCNARGAGWPCFDFVDKTLGRRPRVSSGEDEDVEWAHAIAPMARIVVLRSRSIASLISGIVWEQDNDNANVVSASWGYFGTPNSRFERALFGAVAACDTNGVVCTFPTGDHGSPGVRPSNSPYVLAVGGAAFRPRPDGSLAAEVPWQSGGFGITRFPQPRPPWQRRACPRQAAACMHRAVPDVSATARDVGQYEIPPGTPNQKAGWFQGGGTSLASPLWAALIADADQELANQNRGPIGIGELHAVLYRGWLSAGLDDLGHEGWSKRTGWGAPKSGILDVLVRAIERYRRQH